MRTSVRRYPHALPSVLFECALTTPRVGAESKGYHARKSSSVTTTSIAKLKFDIAQLRHIAFENLAHTGKPGVVVT